MNTLAQYAPDIKSMIVAAETLTPLDFERGWGLSGGHIFHGELSLDQFFTMRPLLGSWSVSDADTRVVHVRLGHASRHRAYRRIRPERRTRNCTSSVVGAVCSARSASNKGCRGNDEICRPLADIAVGARVAYRRRKSRPGRLFNCPARNLHRQASREQPQRMPARPLRPGETPPKGSAVIKGQVTAGGTGAPVRRAQVRAMSMEARGGGVTSTDDNGHFEIKELARGPLHRHA